jgi:hypothetical protein
LKKKKRLYEKNMNDREYNKLYCLIV